MHQTHIRLHPQTNLPMLDLNDTPYNLNQETQRTTIHPLTNIYNPSGTQYMRNNPTTATYHFLAQKLSLNNTAL